LILIVEGKENVSIGFLSGVGRGIGLSLVENLLQKGNSVWVTYLGRQIKPVLYCV